MKHIGATKDASCVGKEPFINIRLAMKVARRMNDRGNGAVRAYRCQFCHMFHVGSVKARH